MSRKIGNSLGLAIGSALVGTLSLSQLASASAVFQLVDLHTGYAIAAMPEGKCGQGSCGVNTLDRDDDGKVSRAEAIAGAFTDTQFDAWDTNADGALDAGELEAMHSTLDLEDENTEAS